MSNITKIAMAQSLKRMLLIKDLDKITISDITNDCGINRQTFYYHFKDIYDLLEWIFANEVVKKIEKETTIKNWQENFKYVLDYMLENKKFYQENNRPYYPWYVERYKKFLDQKIF